jgi:hypothetical protein
MDSKDILGKATFKILADLFSSFYCQSLSIHCQTHSTKKITQFTVKLFEI